MDRCSSYFLKMSFQEQLENGMREERYECRWIPSKYIGMSQILYLEEKWSMDVNLRIITIPAVKEAMDGFAIKKEMRSLTVLVGHRGW